MALSFLPWLVTGIHGRRRGIAHLLQGFRGSLSRLCRAVGLGAGNDLLVFHFGKLHARFGIVGTHVWALHNTARGYRADTTKMGVSQTDYDCDAPCIVEVTGSMAKFTAGLAERHVSRQLRLAYLAPEVLKRLTCGREPSTVTLYDLCRLSGETWQEQTERALG